MESVSRFELLTSSEWVYDWHSVIDMYKSSSGLRSSSSSMRRELSSLEYRC